MKEAAEKYEFDCYWLLMALLFGFGLVWLEKLFCLDGGTEPLGCSFGSNDFEERKTV